MNISSNFLRFWGVFDGGFLFRISGIYAFTSNDIKVGSNIEVDGAPWRVVGMTFHALLPLKKYNLSAKIASDFWSL